MERFTYLNYLITGQHSLSKGLSFPEVPWILKSANVAISGIGHHKISKLDLSPVRSKGPSDGIKTLLLFFGVRRAF